MTDSPSPILLSKVQRIFLAMTAFLLAVCLLIFRGYFNPEAPLQQLARKSLEPNNALYNGRPTVLEFYADWCEACRGMAPSMISLEKNLGNKLDIVLLNVDNPKWQDLMNKYNVLGIPHLNYFDAQGAYKGSSVGLQSHKELSSSLDALLSDNPLPSLTNMGSISRLKDIYNVSNDSSSQSDKVKPRSHG